ncbi:MAG: DNA translocase FtsK, partial [Rhodocyclaceae bacterium]|nr:DNA translocase FtsK [Rhodocyclaceae bacterium]
MDITAPQRPVASPLPEKIVALVNEARWLLVGAVGLYLALILWGYNHADPGWSHAALADSLGNPGGRFGAWLADLFLFLFGFSSWWWVAFLFYLVAWGYGRLEGWFTGDKRPFLIAAAGFMLLLVSSCGIEALRFWSLKASLPLAPGGLLGYEVARHAHKFLGYTGGTLILMATAAIGWSVFTGMSLLRFCERFGTLLELAFFGAINLWQTWQDRRYGRVVAEKREAAVEAERRQIEENPPVPLKIEPVVMEVPKAPKAEARMEKERQAPLFFDAPGGALPPLHLLDEAVHDPSTIPSPDTLEFTSRLIERKLADFSVTVKVLSAHPGPVVTRYEIEPATGVKGAQIVNLAKDLARALSLVSIRVVETVPGKSCMALELPNQKRQTVSLSEIIGSQAYHNLHSPLAISLGKDISGAAVVADLAKMPHLLVAGTTGSGKSVGINAMILSLVYKSEPSAVRMILVDPKMLELSVYQGIPHLLAPVVTDMNKAANALNWCVGEMERRYQLMSALGVRNLAGFNSKLNDARKNGESIKNPFSITPEAPEPLENLP